MKAALSLVGLLSLVLVAAPAWALLDPPTNLTCPIVGTNVEADWDPVTGAIKYSVDVATGYDTNADGLVDTTGDFSFSSFFDAASIPLAELTLEVDTNGDGVLESFAPVAIELKVKALNPGHVGGKANAPVKGKGRQNHPFSAVCVAL